MPEQTNRNNAANNTAEQSEAATTNTGTGQDANVAMPVDLGRQPLNKQSWILIAIGIAFLVGGFLVFFGLANLPRDRHNISLLVACIGFAIVLSEIGTRAAVRHTGLNTGIVVTGAGALALIFYILVNPVALCQFGYGDTCPHADAVRQFTGKVVIHGEDADPRALTVAVVPQTRSVESLGREEVFWAARFPVKMDDDGNVEEPKHIIISYPHRSPKSYSVPVQLNSFIHDFTEVLEFEPSEQIQEAGCEQEPSELRLSGK